MRQIIVPLANQLLGVGVVQRGEWMVWQFANHVFMPVDFKRVEPWRGFHGFHRIDECDGLMNAYVAMCLNLNQFYITLQKINIK